VGDDAGEGGFVVGGLAVEEFFEVVERGLVHRDFPVGFLAASSLAFSMDHRTYMPVRVQMAIVKIRKAKARETQLVGSQRAVLV